MTNSLKYKRVLLKLSGEALQGEEDFGIDSSTLSSICDEIKTAYELNVEIGIVVGGGNLFRGAELAKTNINKVAADQMGMLATVMNAIALQDMLLKKHIPTQHMSPFPINAICKPYNWQEAISYLEKKHIVIFSGGTSNPFCTTDLAACLRGIECSCDIVLKGTKVDGIYNEDPLKVSSAVKYDALSFHDVISKQLKVMDLAAFILAQEHNLPIGVFNIKKSNALSAILLGKHEGSIVS